MVKFIQKITMLLVMASFCCDVYGFNIYFVEREPVVDGCSSCLSKFAYSSDGRCFVAAPLKNMITIFELNKGTGETFHLYFDESVVVLSFSPDGKYLALVAGKTVKVLDRDANWKCVKELDHEASYIRFSPDKRYFVSSRSDGMLKIWDINQQWKPVLELKAPMSCCFSPTGRYLTFQTKGDVQVFDRDIAWRSCLTCMGDEITYSWDEAILFSKVWHKDLYGDNFDINAYETTNWTCTKKISDADFSDNHKHFSKLRARSAMATWYHWKVIDLWKIHDFKVLDAMSNKQATLACSPEGRFLAVHIEGSACFKVFDKEKDWVCVETVSDDGSLEKIAKYEHKAYSSCGGYIASLKPSNKHKNTLLCNMYFSKMKKSLKGFKMQGVISSVSSFVFSPNSRYLVLNELPSNTITVCDLTEEVGTI